MHTTNEAKDRGYKKGRFSFNVKGGRCEACKGDGIIKIEMHFYQMYMYLVKFVKVKDIIEKLYKLNIKDKSIDDVLNMNVEEALEFFENIPTIKKNLKH